MSAETDTRDTEVRSEEDVLRIVAARAIQRLGWIQYAILGGAALLAVVAGGLLALLVSSQVSWPFWTVWLAGSLLFLLAPGLAVMVAGRREARRLERNASDSAKDSR